MSEETEAQRKVLKAVAHALELVHELIPQPLNQRPAFPAIDLPCAGSIITASQTAPTALMVQLSSNRGDIPHYVDLLDADTFAVVDANQPVTFTGNTGNATITIPLQAEPGPTTHILQCRAPASVAGNVHRIFIDIQAPALPAPPVLVLSATAAGMPLPAGSYPRATPGLNMVQLLATATGGSPPLTYNFTVTRGAMPSGSASSLMNTYTVDLIPAGTVFPATVFINAYASDSHGLFSPPVMLSYIIT